MAEPEADTVPAVGLAARLRADLDTYRHLLATKVRSDLSYRASAVLLFVSAMATTLLELVVIVLILQRIPSLAGFSLADMAFLYGTSSLPFSLADGLVGNVDRVPDRIKAGTFDRVLLRPASSLVQVVAEEFSYRSIGRSLQAAVVLAIACTRVHVHWTAGRILLVPSMVVSGTVIFGAVFVASTSISFWLVDAREVSAAVTYGGSYLTQYPLSVYGTWFRRFFCFVVPLAFVNWLPALHVLGRPDPLHLPSWLQLASPAVALATAVVAGRLWRTGIRTYRSTGS